MHIGRELHCFCVEIIRIKSTLCKRLGRFKLRLDGQITMLTARNNDESIGQLSLGDSECIDMFCCIDVNEHL